MNRSSFLISRYAVWLTFLTWSLVGAVYSKAKWTPSVLLFEVEQKRIGLFCVYVLAIHMFDLFLFRRGCNTLHCIFKLWYRLFELSFVLILIFLYCVLCWYSQHMYMCWCWILDYLPMSACWLCTFIVGLSLLARWNWS